MPWGDGVVSPFIKWIKKQWPVEVQKLPGPRGRLGILSGLPASPRPSSHLSCLFWATLVLLSGLCICQHISAWNVILQPLAILPNPSGLDLPSPSSGKPSPSPLSRLAALSWSTLHIHQPQHCASWIAVCADVAVVHLYTFLEPSALGPVLGSGQTIVSKQRRPCPPRGTLALCGTLGTSLREPRAGEGSSVTT